MLVDPDFAFAALADGDLAPRIGFRYVVANLNPQPASGPIASPRNTGRNRRRIPARTHSSEALPDHSDTGAGPTSARSAPVPFRHRHGGDPGQFSASLSALPALTDTPDDGPMAVRSSVRGFLPSRAGREVLANLPKPAMVTSSPRASASAMDANTPPTAASGACFVIPGSPATRSTMSRFLIPLIPLFRTPRQARLATRSPPPKPVPDP